ncbi:tyrosine-type recombinase/integrase [Clostridium sp. YIM B02551]|uniref:tyrosine-type recombinase/integrase n=1 Tax=Clostridium sp. YIM B02551 TaxID=2910679 RepID=UPI001EEA0F75|nr:tyrosine-type recombinase/integrase [Clostridium sp. YIM B02551]
MAVKTNYKKNGSEYFRTTATIGKDSNGNPIRKEFYGKNKTEAEARKREFLDNLGKGLNINYEKAVLGDAMRTWLFEVVKPSVKPGTFERYEGIFRNYIKDNPLIEHSKDDLSHSLETSELYNLRIYTTQSISIQRYYNKLFKKGKSSSSIENLNKILRSFFNYVVEEGFILKNPCSSKRITIPRNYELEENEDIDNEDEIYVFSNEEIKLLEKSLDKNKLKALYLLALSTGLRQGELLGLKWNDIDLDKKELKVQRTIKKVTIINDDDTREGKIVVQVPKTKGSLRTVPIPSKIIPTLEKHKIKQNEDRLKLGESYQNNGEFVFVTDSGSFIDPRNLRRAYKRALKRAGVIYRKFHNLRHTYATKLFEAGVPLPTVQKLLGHSDISITANIYTHVMKEQKIDAADKLNILFS